MDHQGAVEHLLRQVESRVALKDDLQAAARGLFATALILGTVLGLLVAVVAGAMLFAAVLEALSG